MSVTGATGDIAFMDKMLADFRLPTYYLNNNPSTWYFYLYSRLGKDKRTPFILNFHQQASSNHPTSNLSYICLSFLPINSYIYSFIHVFLFMSIYRIYLFIYLFIYMSIYLSMTLSVDGSAAMMKAGCSSSGRSAASWTNSNLCNVLSLRSFVGVLSVWFSIFFLYWSL